MLFDFGDLAPGVAYKLLTSTVVPRPIGWISTLGPTGVVNLAPYSFFNAMGGAPPVVALGLMRAPGGGYKDTARNILDSGQFVVNLVPEALIGPMSETSAAHPPEISEMDLAGLPRADSVHIRPPRLADAPAALECVTFQVVETGPDQVVVIGRVLAAHIADRFVLDAAKGYIDTPAMDLVARMHGAGWYARTSDLFQLDRPATGTGV